MTCPVVGLVGGVGSGKSTLTRSASARFGLAAIDGDAAGHRALTNSEVQDQIRHHFGNSVFTPDGTIDRSRLAQRVFGPSSHRATEKAALERISHPFIERTFREDIDAARTARVPAVLLDAAVLFEAGWDTFCDVVVFVDAPDALRLARVVERGWTVDDWRQREASQLELSEKRRRADAVIENSRSLDEATEALGATIERLCGLSLCRHATTSRPAIPD